MKQDVLFSVVLPVYNTAKYLPKCFESILNQTYKNFEIICINDGSTDNSLEILEEYQNKDSRIKIVSHKNKGLGASRNDAINIIQGEYVCFVDSDDYIELNLLEECVKKIPTKPDVIVFGAKTLYEGTGKIKPGQYSSKNFKYDYNINNIHMYHPVAWNKVYKTKFLRENNILFGTTKRTEDQIFAVKTMLTAQSVAVTKKDLYIYRKNRPGAITFNKTKNDISPIITTYEVEEFLSSINIDIKLRHKILSKHALKSISWYGKTSADYSEIYYKELKGLLDYLRSKDNYWWNYFNLSKNNSYFLLKLEYIKSLLLYRIIKK